MTQPSALIIYFPGCEPMGGKTKRKDAGSPDLFRLGAQLADEVNGIAYEKRFPLYLLETVKKMLPEDQASTMQTGFHHRVMAHNLLMSRS